MTSRIAAQLARVVMNTLRKPLVKSCVGHQAGIASHTLKPGLRRPLNKSCAGRQAGNASHTPKPGTVACVW